MTPGTRVVYFQRYDGGGRAYMLRHGTFLRFAGKTRAWVRLDNGRETCVPKELVEAADA